MQTEKNLSLEFVWDFFPVKTGPSSSVVIDKGVTYFALMM